MALMNGEAMELNQTKRPTQNLLRPGQARRERPTVELGTGRLQVRRNGAGPAALLLAAGAGLRVLGEVLAAD